MNRILILLIRLLHKERAEMEPDSETKDRIYESVRKECEEEAK